MSKRVVITTFGSYGDLHPYIAIALELKKRGHEPVIATFPYYRKKIESIGLSFHPVRPDLPPPDQNTELLRRTLAAKTGAAYLFKEILVANLADSYDDLLEVSRDADLLITHPITLAGPIVAEKLKMPWISTVLAPISFFSIHEPLISAVAPGLTKFITSHPLTAKLLVYLMRQETGSWAEPIYRFRRKVGLRANGHPVFEGQHSPTRVLALFSPHFAKPQPDWPKQTITTGFSFYDHHDEKTDEEKVSRLKEFIQAGTPPIVFTLGSTAVWLAGDFYKESIAAIEELNERAILLVGNNRNLSSETLPENIIAFDYLPYSEIFPHAKLVVHSGGVGTTAQVLRAGRPMLIVPFSFDQPDNADRIARLGLGRTVALDSYQRGRVVAELTKLLGDGRYFEHAELIGERVRKEDGSVRASDAIEEVLNRG
jgi:rhamnosyltransferase subunit B